MNHWRPWLLGGMTALFVARPLFPSEAAAIYGDGLPVVMLWIALGVFWLLGAIGQRQFQLRFGWTDAAVLLLVVWHTVAALWAVADGTPRPAMNMLWEWVGLGLCFFLARQFIATPREGRAVAAVMVALAVAVSAYGLYQCAFEFPATRAIYKANPERALRDAGLSFPPHSPGRKLFEDRLANNEPTATFALCNSLAGFLAPWLVVLAGMIGSGVRNRKQWAGMLILAIPIAACLLLTKSRSGYLGAGAGLASVWLLSRGRRVRIGWKLPAAVVALAILLTSAAVAVEGPAVLERASKSFGYRLQYWQSSLRMIADNPWMGCGPGNFQEVYTQYKLPEASEEIADPHDFLLEIWATAGTPAALAFLGVLGCFAWSVSRGEGRGAGDGGKSEIRNPKSEIPNPKSQIRNPKSEIPNSKSSINNQQSTILNFPDAWLQVFLGGLVGFLLSLPLGMLSAAPPGLMPVLLGLPLAAATIGVLLVWIRDGRLPRWLPAVGVVVLLIDLLATGGIGFPGVAGTLWLLLALGLQHEPARRTAHGPPGPCWPAPLSWPWRAMARPTGRSSSVRSNCNWPSGSQLKPSSTGRRQWRPIRFRPSLGGNWRRRDSRRGAFRRAASRSSNSSGPTPRRSGWPPTRPRLGLSAETGICGPFPPPRSGGKRPRTTRAARR